MSAPGKDDGFRAGRAAGTAIAALVVVAMAVVLRPDAWLTRALAPAPSSTPGPAPSPAPRATRDVGAAWGSLTITQLPDWPAGAVSVVSWSGGYLALDRPEGTPARAWTSTDGRAWLPLPSGTFGDSATAANAVAALGGLVVGVARPDGTVDVYRSEDARTWARTTGPRLALGPDQLAGTPAGVLGVVAGDPTRLAFSADGVTWLVASPPGLNRTAIDAVAAFDGGFAALGSMIVPVADAAGGTAADGAAGSGMPRGTAARSSPPQIAAAWWSPDGLTWRLAPTTQLLFGGFGTVAAGAAGLVAVSRSPGAPGRATYWQSSDGQAWTASDADPLGVLGAGQGEGSAIGTFAGDGRRIVVVGSPAAATRVELWWSRDGLAWTKLALRGDLSPTMLDGIRRATPFVVRDGLLLVSPSGTWLGVAGGF